MDVTTELITLGKRVLSFTTAASLLFTAVLGLGVALGAHALVIGAQILILIINFGIRRRQAWLAGRPA